MAFHNHTFHCAALATLLLCSCQSHMSLRAPSQEENRQMAAEANSFLTNMPAGLQDRQTEAILQAIAGDCTALQQVRNARNQAPMLSSNVCTRMVSPTLRLYEARESDGKRLPLLIYLHGGGWTFGSLNSCARFCDAVAASGHVKVLAVDYRLAPEHPYPAGLDDCLAAIAYAREHASSLGIDPKRISVGGDSAGGNLALASALTDLEHGDIHSLVLFYPVTKAFADGSASWTTYGKGYGLDADIMEAFNQAYTGGRHMHDPLVSPALCNRKQLAHLPRTLLIAAGHDILRDQGKNLQHRMDRRMTRLEFPQATHLFITVPGQETAFRKSVQLTVEFLTK